ncbi:hypothetical protein NSE_0487 [Neorickettsia sennetsu str. Miyayama]|uniref:Uncharacterized protein n=1 Tax=Ehrlichia sennetsu (strain ATCC VR-367 / Miyayama) TaxID=222891 RepID=Q2GDS5_EHRS3|nr:hypothetical protein NSE_0487 [Neorickettsia sennetsu str. Miyayama]
MMEKHRAVLYNASLKYKRFSYILCILGSGILAVKRFYLVILIR